MTFPNTETSWAFCTRCGRNVKTPAEQDSGICRRCKHLMNEDQTIKFSIGDGKVVLSPDEGIPNYRKGDILLCQESGKRFLCWVKEIIGHSWLRGVELCENGPRGYRSTCSVSSKEEIVALVGHKVVPVRDATNMMEQFLAAHPNVFNLKRAQ